MKKVLNFSCIIAMTLILGCVMVVTLPVNVGASAMELDNDEYDEVFLENTLKLAEENYGEGIELSATKENLYDLNLVQIGYVYDFTINGENGYAIVVNVNGYFEVAEIYFDAVNPFENITTAERIYVSNMVYLCYADGVFYDAEMNSVVSNQTLDFLREIAYYSDGSAFSTASEYIYFSNRTTNKYVLAQRHPYIHEVSGYTNACAAIAGTSIVQYWDRYKINLIGNYDPGSLVRNIYLYNGPSTATDNVVIQLYSDMATSSSGTTISNFKNGLSTYCQRYGYSITYSSCMNNGSFNYNTAKQYLDSNIPLILFVDVFSVADISQHDSYDYIAYLIGNGAHVMAGFGYNEVTYTLTNGTTRFDKYIAVASGYISSPRGYYNINYNTQIDDVYAISVA